MDPQKTSIRGENEMQNLHFSIIKCIFAQEDEVCQHKAPAWGINGKISGLHRDYPCILNIFGLPYEMVKL